MSCESERNFYGGALLAFVDTDKVASREKIQALVNNNNEPLCVFEEAHPTLHREVTLQDENIFDCNLVIKNESRIYAAIDVRWKLQN